MTTRFRSRFIATGTLLAGLTVSLLAAAKLAQGGASGATFHASGPAGMNIDGTASDVRVSDDGTTIVVTVGLGGLTTGMSLRDKHAKDALETTTFPDSALSVPRASLKFPAAGADSSGDAQGSLKLHGQTKSVTFHYTASVDGSGLISVKGSTSINLPDYGITPPSYLGVGIKPGVGIGVNFQAKDN